jgi:hypothetical protein
MPLSLRHFGRILKAKSGRSGARRCVAAAKWFHKELEESYYFSNEADHFINEDFSSEEADAFLRHQDHQLDILKRFEQMPEDDRRTKNVLSELRMGLNRADEAESRGNRTGTPA